MERVRIAHGLFLWQDDQATLEPCLRSTAPHVEALIIAEGLIDGVPDLGLPWHTDIAWMANADWLPAQVPISSKQSKSPALAPWTTLSAACNWILGTARRLDIDWLLYVDADQELHNGDQLAAWLDGYTGAAFPIERQDQVRHLCPWQLVHVSSVRRYVSGCYVVELMDGTVTNLALADGGKVENLYANAPWISHHPDRRPPWRRHGRLGQFETVLEPPPPAAPLQLPPSVVEAAGMSEAAVESAAPSWYCPGCGARYFGPGSCQNGHAPTELEQDPAMIAADPSTSSSGAADDGATNEEPVSAQNAPAPAAPPEEPAPVEEPAPAAPVEPPAPEPAPAAPEPAPAPADEQSVVDRARDLLRQAHDLLASL